MKYRLILLFTLLFLLALHPVFAAGEFTNISATLPGVANGDAQWGDYDNDGDLDIALTGSVGGTRTTQIRRNDGGTFVDISGGFPALTLSSVAWGDFDHDGDLDLLMGGNGSPNNTTQLWRNDTGNFVNTNTSLTGVQGSNIEWGDYDNDGDLDALIAGFSTANVTELRRNDGGTLVNVTTSIPGVHNGDVNWGDYDNDGDLDIALVGSTDDGNVSQIWRNDNGVFTNISAGLPNLVFGSLAWGDYDNDSDLDLLLSGYDSIDTTNVTDIWQNNNGTFIGLNAGLTQIANSSVTWGDYDNDGDLDILMAGSNLSFVEVTEVWTNNNGTFANLNAGIIGFQDGSVAWGDYDNDRDLDILVTGGSFGTTQIWRNNIVTANAAPAAPTNLNAVVNGNSVTLSWTASADDHTPASGLTYNVYVGNTPGAGNIVSPMANIATGLRRIPAPGGAGHGTSATFTFADITTAAYYWSVQAVDSSYVGGAFATETTFSENQPPVLAPIGNRTIALGETLSFTATATDANVGQTLTYSLSTDQIGAAIDPVTGVFSWTPSVSGTFNVTIVVSDNGLTPLSDTEAFTVTVTSANLIANGGFETPGSKPSKPAIWRGIGLLKDRLKCNNDTTIFAYSGDCAFRFVGSEAENARLIQTTTQLDAVTSGMTINTDFYYRTNSVKPRLKVKLVVFYENPSVVGLRKTTINTASVDEYRVHNLESYDVEAGQTLAKLKLQFQNRAASGKIYLDDINVTYSN